MTQVTTERRGDVAILTMDDGKANALSPSLIAELREALAGVSDAKAVVLAGRPGKLSAGFDLKVMMAGGETTRALLVDGAELLLALYGHPAPVVAACTGHAIAGGALLLAASDVRVGAEGAFKIGLNEIAIGVPLPIFAHALAADRLDPRHFVRATLGATLYAPEQAVEVGWLDEIAPPEEVLPRALAVAEAMCGLKGAPFAFTKQVIRRRTIEHVRQTLDADLEAIGAALGIG